MSAGAAGTRPPAGPPPDRLQPTERLAVPETVIRELLAHARDEAPLECCGLLLGAGARIERSLRARNVFESPTRYRIHPADHFAAIRAARTLRLDVIGAYHSHPASAPLPSETDRLEGESGLVYVIVSALADARPPIAAWRLERGNFREIALVPVP